MEYKQFNRKLATPLGKALLVAGMLLGSGALQAGEQALLEAVNSDFRREANVERDQYRHPEQTLAFFGITAEQTVIELWPGGGWYTEILAPMLADKGQYIAAGFNTEPQEDNPGSRYRAKAGKRYLEWLQAHPKELGKIELVVLDPPAQVKLGEDASADAVLTFRNLHNWASQGQLQTVFQAAFNVLKDGGVFGVVEHRGKAGNGPDSGYMMQDEMIALAEKVGFTLEASSEINANAKDSKDYPKGVWTLPPTLRLGEQDRDTYLKIGESDRMTLKFIKKAN
ncbi:class I SAM-dependent methyltransferase [Shewanella algae]|uniref:class I SAM-dependent methyltransferase n=1 Tax=Shewanella algae TaxID=38313 RepID=UPI001BEE97E3|nr:methyltransferase [Shewanella algae]